MKKIAFPDNRFEQFMVDSVRGTDKILVYVDGDDPRTAVAAAEFTKLNPSRLIFLGTAKKIEDNLYRAGLKSDKIEIIEPGKSERSNHYCAVLKEVFAGRGKDIGDKDIAGLVSKTNYYAALMLKEGRADGCVSGSISSTGDMMKPLIQVIGTGDTKKSISGAAMQIIPDSSCGLGGKILFSDIAVIPDPDEKQMIDIVLESYKTAKILFEDEPKIAMLSYSTRGSAKSEKIDQINKVIEKIKKIDPVIKIDGELQFDAAVAEDVARNKGGSSEVAGHANVLIFPNLDAGNICIKAIHRLAKTKYYGTIIQGSPIPFNDLSRGCDPVEILSMSMITLMQIKEKESVKKK
jgi:phosphate acetyltransferase